MRQGGHNAKQPCGPGPQRRFNGRGEASDGGFEELDDPGAGDGQVSPKHLGMIRNHCGRQRHCRGRERGMDTCALASHRMAAIGLAVRRMTRIAGRVSHGTSIGLGLRGFLAVAGHRRSLGSDCCFNSLRRFRIRGAHRRGVGNRGHATLQQQQDGTQQRHLLANHQEHAPRVGPSPAARKTHFTDCRLPGSDQGLGEVANEVGRRLDPH